MQGTTRGIWECKIGETSHADLLPGADLPMRAAVERAYEELTGVKPRFLFSGWGGDLTPTEQACVDED